MRLSLFALLAGGLLNAQNVELGKKQYESRCAVCHGGDGMGGELGLDPRRFRTEAPLAPPLSLRPLLLRWHSLETVSFRMSHLVTIPTPLHCGTPTRLVAIS